MSFPLFPLPEIVLGEDLRRLAVGDYFRRVDLTVEIAPRKAEP